VADLGEGPGGVRPPLLWVKKKKKSQKEEKPTGQAKQNCPPALSSRSGSATGLLPFFFFFWNDAHMAMPLERVSFEMLCQSVLHNNLVHAVSCCLDVC